MKRKIIWGVTILLVCFLGGELLLRNIWGFGKMPLYYASNKYEYMPCPNQSGIRFGNHYRYNSYSQRSDEPDSTKLHVLGLGDSVLYGGTQTDQDSLATSLFTKDTGIQMLNISAGSWGPDNCAAYLKEYGLFNAKALFLLVSSHDAYDNMDFQPTVGHHPSYPDKQYASAWQEILCRYIYPQFIKPYLHPSSNDPDPDQKVLQGIHKSGKEFNSGFEELRKIAQAAKIPFIICLHADKFELQSKCYNEQGQEIIQWAADHNIPLVKDMDYGITDKDYRDDIHINAHGQKKLTEIMKETLLNEGNIKPSYYAKDNQPD